MRKAPLIWVAAGGPVLLALLLAVLIPLVEPSLTPAQGALAGLLMVPFFLYLTWHAAWSTSAPSDPLKPEMDLRRWRRVRNVIRISWVFCLGVVVACTSLGRINTLALVCFCWLFVGGLLGCTLSDRCDHLCAEMKRKAR